MAYTRTTWVTGTTPLSASNMNNIEDGINEALTNAQGNETMWSYIRNLVYPVGSIYMSATISSKDDVEALLGGTWVAWGSGRVPVGVDTTKTAFDTPEETGGSADAIIPQHNHTATFSGSAVGAHTHTGPSHSHSIAAQSISVSGTAIGTTDGNGAHSHDYYRTYTTQFSESGNETTHTCVSEIGSYTTTAVGNHAHSFSGTVAASGTLAAHNTNNAGTGATGSAGGFTPEGTVTVASSGTSVTDANLQPYITCYMYKRTA